MFAAPLEGSHVVSRGLRDSLQVEWFNVTYRSIVLGVAALLLLVAGGGGYWFWSRHHAPRQQATAAIERAELRLGEAARLDRGGEVAELVGGAGTALDEARGELLQADYDHSRVAAMRSENLSLKALAIARGDDDASGTMVRFYRIEGDVRVKKTGAFSWESADSRMMLRIGDQIKTSSSASAELLYFDGTVTRIEPGSLLEIKDLYQDPVTNVRRVREKLTWGELRASTQKRNVRGSYHEVATERATARAEDAGEFRVAFDRERRTAEFDVFDGKIQVGTGSRKENLIEGERIRTTGDGTFGAKQRLPGVPMLISPSDQRVFIFGQPERERIPLSWEQVGGAARYNLMISDGALFTRPLYDAERRETTVVIDGVPTGTYYWRVAALNPDGARGPFSEARRFRVTSQQIRDAADAEPPPLEIHDFVAVGAMVIVNGSTEPGASLWIDNEKVEVNDNGTFYAVVRLRKEGLNELAFVAQDTAGNETAIRRPAYYEMF